MDVRTQDAIERLMRSPDWAHLVHWVRDRQEVYHTSLATVNPNQVDFVAQYQGRVAAYNEMLSLEAYINELKSERTQ